MGILDKYKVANKPPKIVKAKAKVDVMAKVNANFVKGLDKQIKQAKAYKPRAKDLRSWVTRDLDSDKAWMTVRYGSRPLAIKGTSKTTLGPVPLDGVVDVLNDIKKAHAAGDLDAALKKASVLGTRKKKQS